MIYVVFVHGTYARGAGWTAPGSPLELALRLVVGATGEFVRFEWSGRNSFVARARAIHELHLRLLATARLDPAARIYIVAHSHGGNIALQAARTSALVERIEGVVCLATPVITGTPTVTRMSGSFVGSALAFLILGVALSGVAIYFSEVLLGTYDDLQLGQKVLTWVVRLAIGTPLLIATTYFAIWATTRASKRLNAWLARRAAFIIEQTRAPELPRNRVVFFRHPGDEASALGSAVHLASWLAGSTSEIFHRLAQLAEKLAGKFLSPRTHTPFWSAMFFLALALVALRELPGESANILRQGFTWLYWLSSAFFVAFVLTGLLAWLVTLAMRLIAGAILVIFFGPELLFVRAAVRLTVEATPLGLWEVMMLAPGQPKDWTKSGDTPFPYAHGRVYGHPEFVAATANWIGASLARNAEGSQTANDT